MMLSYSSKRAAESREEFRLEVAALREAAAKEIPVQAPAEVAIVGMQELRDELVGIHVCLKTIAKAVEQVKVIPVPVLVPAPEPVEVREDPPKAPEVTWKSPPKSPPPPPYDYRWLDDFEEARKIAKRENLVVVISYTGSDWCAFCLALERDVFGTEEFKKHVKGRYVLVMVDFPRYKELSLRQKAWNEALRQKYNKGSTGVPVLVVVDPKTDRILNRFGYVSTIKLFLMLLEIRFDQPEVPIPSNVGSGSSGQA